MTAYRVPKINHKTILENVPKIVPKIVPKYVAEIVYRLPKT
jgi:hypothetical protein